jgi:hypothetical protein
MTQYSLSELTFLGTYDSIQVQIESMEKFMKVLFEVSVTNLLDRFVHPVPVIIINQPVVVDAKDFVDPESFESWDVQHRLWH